MNDCVDPRLAVGSWTHSQLSEPPSKIFTPCQGKRGASGGGGTGGGDGGGGKGGELGRGGDGLGGGGDGGCAGHDVEDDRWPQSSQSVP